jgi:hypothetical protein
MLFFDRSGGIRFTHSPGGGGPIGKPGRQIRPGTFNSSGRAAK